MGKDENDEKEWRGKEEENVSNANCCTFTRVVIKRP
jgi:hypothetical protein